jgi:hypothetical protein
MKCQSTAAVSIGAFIGFRIYSICNSCSVRVVIRIQNNFATEARYLAIIPCLEGLSRINLRTHVRIRREKDYEEI